MKKLNVILVLCSIIFSLSANAYYMEMADDEFSSGGSRSYGSYSVYTPPTPVVVAPLAPTISTRYYSPIELETIALVNEYRVRIGKRALIINDYLSSKSEAYDNWMILNNMFCHCDFVNRSSIIQREMGVISVGEILAYNYSTASGVFNAWLNSYRHKSKIEGDFTRVGFAIRRHTSTLKLYHTMTFVK